MTRRFHLEAVNNVNVLWILGKRILICKWWQICTFRWLRPSTLASAIKHGVDQSSVIKRLQDKSKISKPEQCVEHILRKKKCTTSHHHSHFIFAEHEKVFHSMMCLNSWPNPLQVTALTADTKLFGNNVLLSIWWKMKCTFLYKFLKSIQTVTDSLFDQCNRKLKVTWVKGSKGNFINLEICLDLC